MRGKDYQQRNRRSKVWDHPRLCGEKLFQSSVFVSTSGSPPPMRGKDNKIYTGGFYLRITPAYAGKSEDLPACLLVF